MAIRRIAASTVLLLGLWPFAGLVAQEKGDEDEPAADVQASWWEEEDRFWSVIVEQYRARAAYAAVPSDSIGGDEAPLDTMVRHDETDHDLRLFLEGGARDSQERFGVSFVVSAFVDADGSIPESAYSTFSSLQDVNEVKRVDVYEFTGEYRAPRGFLKLARVGRQTSEFGQPRTFDGGALTLRLLPTHLDLFLQGGRTVHFYETEAGLFEDWIGSGGIVVRPNPENRCEAEYRFLREDTALQEGIQDHWYGLSWWNRSLDWLHFNAYARGLDNVLAHAGGKGKLMVHSLAMGADFFVDFQPATIREVHEFDNPFFSILGKSTPHSRWLVDLWKEIKLGRGELALHVGWNGRILLEGEETPFNRNFARFYLLAEITDLLINGPFVSVSGEYHYDSVIPGESGEKEITTGGAAGYHSDMFRVEAGTYYQRFKYTFFRDANETADVRTWYAALSLKPLHWLTLKARYEFEQFDWDVHTVTISAVQAF